MNEAERRAASEKYYQDLRKKLDERIRSDKQLQKIAEKVANKTADFNDTAKYSEIASNHLANVLQENIGEINSPLAKEYVCKELLKDQHSAINELFGSVQVSIDEQNGIHIKTQKPAFPQERVDKVAHALEDPTVSPKTTKRRAGAPVANVSKSFHDDCVKKNATFRNDAGLTCYIIREGSNCCEWCSSVAGKYRFGTQPDDIFRRHDNCDCTIIYDGQVLRGQLNLDGATRNTTWQQIGDVPAEYEPTSFTQEQAKELERQNLQRFRGLTNGENSGKIRNIEIGDISAAIKGGTIQKDVAKTIIDTLDESNSRDLFDRVAVVQADPKIVMQTDPIKKGTFFDTQLNLNESFLGGKTVEEIDAELKNSDFTVANSLREAVIHEKYHAKLISDLNQDQLEALYDILSDYHIDGISKTAWKDGSECIAEVGVLFERGETDDLPQKAKDLFNKYIGGIL